MHGTSCIVGMRAAGISTTISSKFYVMDGIETGSYINIMQTTSHINNNGRFTIIGECMHGVMNNGLVLTVN